MKRGDPKPLIDLHSLFHYFQQCSFFVVYYHFQEIDTSYQVVGLIEGEGVGTGLSVEVFPCQFLAHVVE